MFTARIILIVLTMSFFGCGKQGSQGSAGAPGQAGAAAQPCTVTTIANGAQINCPNGSSATVYDGAAGSPGTVVSAVQFCPSNFVPSYPNTFAEVGFCIGGNLYGVYSANGGFMAMLPPGVYSSDGINASCSFTIQPNCVVSN